MNLTEKLYCRSQQPVLTSFDSIPISQNMTILLQSNRPDARSFEMRALS